jgi:tyrosinase
MEYGGGEYGEVGGGQVLTRYDIYDLNNGLIPEFPVKSPPGWDDISLYYAKALQKMGWIGATNPGRDVEKTWTYSQTPNQYYFQAAIHWTPKTTGLPPNWQQWWDHCTHESGAQSTEEFFLPWHRAYIYWFEVIIRSYVAQLGGPENWTLPYWNYSGDYDASDPSAPWPRSVLPWVFGQATLPDGSGNPLFLDKVRRGLQPGIQLEVTTPYYYQAYDLPAYQDFNQTLDQTIHGAVHGDVGSGDGVVSSTGWMQRVPPAAFDPIFWLHHAEIDRFWVGWLANGNSNPTDDGWLQANDDPERANRWNFWQDGDINNVVNVYPGDVADNENLAAPCPYSYKYENLPEMPPPRPPGVADVRAAAPAALRAGGGSAPDPVIASSAEPVQLGKEPVSHDLPLSDEADPVVSALSDTPEEAPRVYLHLDEITADGPPGNYEVYLNYPDADRTTAGTVPHYVGVLAGFGADHVHGEGEEHAHGLSVKYDITELVNHLRSVGDWDESKATVTFVPASRAEPDDLVIEGMQVGNVSIRAS